MLQKVIFASSLVLGCASSPKKQTPLTEEERVLLSFAKINQQLEELAKRKVESMTSFANRTCDAIKPEKQVLTADEEIRDIRYQVTCDAKTIEIVDVTCIRIVGYHDKLPLPIYCQEGWRFIVDRK